MLPIGDYAIAVEWHAVDGQTTVIYRDVSVFSGAATDLGHIVFAVAASVPGSATFTWDLHQYSLDAPAEGCQPGETIYIEVSGIDAFAVDCAQFSSQQVTGLAPGIYDAYVALQANGAVEDDPRPGFGFSELTIQFDVLTGADTVVPIDFVVEASNTRDAPSQATRIGTSLVATCSERVDAHKCLPQRSRLSPPN